MAIYTVFLALGPLVAGTVGSYIAAAHGWRWINWTNVILAACVLTLCFFFQPETLFDRAKAMGQTENGVANADDKRHSTAVEEVGSDRSFKPYTFTQSLGMGVYRPGLGRKLIAPFLTLRLPGVWIVMFQYAGLVAGVVTISIVGSQLLSEPPYLWGQNAGLINIGGIIGTFLGALYTYLLADRVLTHQAKHENHGYGEPEIRLVTQFPGLALATFGIWIFGACAQNPAPGRWVGLQFGYGMLTFGLMQAPSVGFNYVS
jgi:MFS family permease